MKHWWLILLWLCAASATAHKPSDSYLTLERRDAAISGRWDIALRDLDGAIALDANADGEITWGEVRSRRADIGAYALSRLDLTSGGKACTLSVADLLTEIHSDGAYAVLMLAAGAPHHRPPPCPPNRPRPYVPP